MRCFFDSNVLVYMFDGAAPAKKARARELFKQATDQGVLLLSTQVLQEFFVAVTRKLGLPHEQAEQAVQDLAVLPMVNVNADLILRAIAGSRRHRLSFWDALILSAALHGGATLLYTEDLRHSQVFDGLTVENPFRDQ